MQVLEVYRYISNISQEMLEYARQEEWDELLAAEQKRAEAVAQLMSLMQDEVGMSEIQVDEITRLTKQVQFNDELTVGLTRAWTGELQEILRSISSSKVLQQAYKEQ